MEIKEEGRSSRKPANKFQVLREKKAEGKFKVLLLLSLSSS